MHRNSCSRCNSCSNCCNRCNYGGYCCDRCNDFLWPMMFWMLRDMTRKCRCNFVDRYDRFRC